MSRPSSPSDCHRGPEPRSLDTGSPANPEMSIPPPSFASGSALPLPDPEAYEGEPREYARALMQRKDEIEAEIAALKDVLASHGVTTQTSLFDPEGFPRADIDVYAIRHARAAIVRLQTDQSTVNRLLAPALEAAFTPDPASSSQPPSSVSSTVPNGHTGLSVSTYTAEPAWDAVLHATLPDDWPDRPVARVNTVASGSPASQAGLEAGDFIFDFAGVTAVQGMQALGPLVARSEGVPLSLLVQRPGGVRRILVLTPRSGWGGRGSLGCHILPP